MALISKNLGVPHPTFIQFGQNELTQLSPVQYWFIISQNEVFIHKWMAWCLNWLNKFNKVECTKCGQGNEWNEIKWNEMSYFI